MAYELTINRVMGLCAYEDTTAKRKPKRLRGRPLVVKFHKQMLDMYEYRLGAAYNAILEEARHLDLKVAPAPLEGRQKELDVEIFQESGDPLEATEFFDTDDDDDPVETSPDSDRLVGLFQSRRYRLSTQNMTWDMRVRPSVTACALERPDGLTKLWWTFEGVPADPAAERRPDENDSVDFIRSTSKFAEAALPHLYEAYKDTLKDALKDVVEDTRPELKFMDEHIQVSLADNDGLPFAKLVDAMFLRRARFVDVLQGNYDAETTKGAVELLDFIKEASGATPDENSIVLIPGPPGSAAIYCTVEAKDENANGKVTHVVAGLANSIDMLSSGLSETEEWRRINYRPGLLRSISAARPLSAKLANQRAKMIESPQTAAPVLSNG